jgi:hypothetical protein
MNILTANLLFSTLVFWIAAKLYLFPRLQHLKPRTVLLPVLLLHSFRHLGLMFLAPGATYAGIPMQFAYPAAFGDLLAALLALAAIPAVALNWKGARFLVWIFAVEGTLDLVAAIALATFYGAHVPRSGVLDTCILGSCVIGNALHNVHNSDQVLEWSGLTVAQRGCPPAGLRPRVGRRLACCFRRHNNLRCLIGHRIAS